MSSSYNTPRIKHHTLAR